MTPIYTREDLDGKVIDFNYVGPRGKIIFENPQGKFFDAFICHGCQSCWEFDTKADRVYDCGPHFLQFDEWKPE